MKRIHPEDPRVTQHALGELSRREAAEVDRAALLDPDVQEAIDGTRQLAGLLDQVLGQGQLTLGEERRELIRSAGRAPNITALASASPRRRWGRAALVSSAAAGLMLATVFVLNQTPGGGGGGITEGPGDVLNEGTVMRLLLEPAPGPERVKQLTQGTPGAPSLPKTVASSGEKDEEWVGEYRNLTRLLHEDPARYFEKVERVARKTKIEELALLPSLTDNPFVVTVDKPKAMVPVVAGTASFALVERFIRGEKALPPRNAVRVEELVNSIQYSASGDSELRGVRLGAELVRCPWDPEKLLLGVLLQNGSEETIPSTAALRLDVKPDLVQSYRLVGYAGTGGTGRVAAVDAGLAAGRSNFVLYELLPTEKDLEERWVMVKVEFSLASSSGSGMIVPVMSPPREWAGASDNLQTAAIMAGYGLLLRGSEFKGSLDSDMLTDLAETSLFSQRKGDLARREALQLVIYSRILLETR